MLVEFSLMRSLNNANVPAHFSHETRHSIPCMHSLLSVCDHTISFSVKTTGLNSHTIYTGQNHELTPMRASGNNSI